MTSESTDCNAVDMLAYERALWSRGLVRIAGVDEAGHGPLAGPVVAAAAIFERDVCIVGVTDSKQLAAEAREALYEKIVAGALAFGIGVVNHSVIDEINILQATFRAMNDAIQQISPPPDHLLIDGNRFFGTGIPFTTIIGGDAASFCIAAASILAKVTRDRIMVEYDTQFPGYGFAKHKGYGTKDHHEAIERLGLCAIHRRSFAIKSQYELEFEEAP